jgi:hypothetical protein
LVLVAPHGGRRDPSADPWHGGGLRTNDLHTAALTIALARATGAAAIVNDVHDRNRVDLNRVDQVVERLPAFLDAIHDALARAVDRHGRVTLLTVHGWNTTAPAVDVGLGCRPGCELGGDRPGPAVSPLFATHALPAFHEACARRGIGVSVGRRYPARARQNLIQLFTGRWLADERDAVARVARFGTHCDAMQLELGIPLRWPGRWRDAFVDAVRAATPALLDPASAPAGAAAGRAPAGPDEIPPRSARRLEFVSDTACGIGALDAQGGRLLLVGLHTGLDLFTHERIGSDGTSAVGALSLRDDADRATLGYHGPIGRFADTDAFLDLEVGLAGATVAEADVDLTFRPAHAAGEPCPFGDVAGRVRVAGRMTDVRGPAFLASGSTPATSGWLDLGRGRRIALPEHGAEALLCEDGWHRRVRCSVTASAARTRIATIDASPPLHVDVETEHRIPIVRGRSRPATTLALATFRTGAGRVGWGQRSDPEESGLLRSPPAHPDA